MNDRMRRHKLDMWGPRFTSLKSLKMNRTICLFNSSCFLMFFWVMSPLSGSDLQIIDLILAKL